MMAVTDFPWPVLALASQPDFVAPFRPASRKLCGLMRQGEKAVALCAKPWDGVTLRRRVKKEKPGVSRDQAAERGAMAGHCSH
jgi:hypothetical protein